MIKTWPALEAIASDSDLLLAELDDFSPTAIEDLDNTTRVFFSSSDTRNKALNHLAAARITASAVDVPDEDWARRSQEALTPIEVGRVLVTPPWHATHQASGARLQIVIEPSMGFGTGHHATTRLCLEALQSIELSGADVLDVGTGSGVLAIAAAALGARSARGIDCDRDAIQSARENLHLNPCISGVTFLLADISDGIGQAVADVVTANLTGALLIRAADILTAAVRPGGTIVASGLMAHERPAVEAALAGAQVVRASQEDEWAALTFRRPGQTAPKALQSK